jgi:hypothetical protein
MRKWWSLIKTREYEILSLSLKGSVSMCEYFYTEGIILWGQGDYKRLDSFISVILSSWFASKMWKHYTFAIVCDHGLETRRNKQIRGWCPLMCEIKKRKRETNKQRVIPLHICMRLGVFYAPKMRRWWSLIKTQEPLLSLEGDAMPQCACKTRSISCLSIPRMMPPLS